ncbi:hypothetical protein L931_03565 [Helicobacter pylori PZ5024]|uniref:Uncharacterized protein n=1 Tax=Helicobacter pylori PZ5024 TaxID=1337391 RepID=T2SQC4_HELPX|nr:hypothetical protein L931_03565 [Helicobacter pylori PZ5024]EQD96419.1 hypothetical protein L930_06455 [Helicobacter pylori PZ5004]
MQKAPLIKKRWQQKLKNKKFFLNPFKKVSRYF